MKLTKQVVEKLSYDPAKGENDLRFDDDLPGFGVRLYPSGSKRFFVTYWAAGRQRRQSIGEFGTWTLEAARVEARRIKSEAERGIDGLAAKQESRRVERRMTTLRAYWTEHFFPSVRNHWKPGTIAANASRWENHLAPALGDRSLAEITKGDAKRLLADIRAKAGKRAPEGKATNPGDRTVTANRATELLRQILNHAIEGGFLDGPNPVSKVKTFREAPREAILTGEQIAALFAAIAAEEALGGKKAVARTGEAEPGKRGGKGLKEAESRGISTHAAALFRLLLLTGARLREIMLAKWDWIDWQNAALRLPDSKTGAKVVWLNSLALAELKRLWDLRATSPAPSPWIIEGSIQGQALVCPQRPWRRVRERAGLTGLRLHDLRHGYASIGVTSGVALFVVGKALGHASPATTERYANIANNPVRAAAETIGRAISEAISGAARIQQVRNPEDRRDDKHSTSSADHAKTAG